MKSSISEPRVKVDEGYSSGLLQNEGVFMVCLVLLGCLLLVCGVSRGAFGQEAPEYGPASGALVIEGGVYNSAIWERFIVSVLLTPSGGRAGGG